MANITFANASLEDQGYGPYITTLYMSAFLLSIFSPITVVSNTLLLVAIYKDPFKSFRKPVTYFIISLALVDLVTGLIVEPFFAVYYFACHFYQTFRPGKYFEYLFKISTFLSIIVLSSSFFLVLALTTTQYIAITFPHRYKILFTKKRVLVAVCCHFVYFAIFSSLQYTKIPADVYLRINLHLHPTVVGVLLTVAHIFLYKSFRRFSQRSKAIRKRSSVSRSLNQRSEGAHGSKNETKHQKQLTVVALMLSALLILCSFPHIVAFYIFLYTKPMSFDFLLKISIALRVSDVILFFKVALDAYIYAWRHPKYRKALKDALLCFRLRKSVVRDRDTEQEMIATGY
ncbi:histamine H2 receptor-like [Stylophora pistillata]|uniref:histamine H2 receptor-like n=1 Tax=Stylophora pistillata TaxID=50429 RepID=UPI000C046A19|nr:histamine H2 receptor-like [Stylophora pistillata]